MTLWAYGTSPYGLGLSSDGFWDLGFREYDALRKQHRKHLERWALEQAMFANVWRKEGTPAFRPEDFIDAGARERHIAEHQQEQRDIALANAALAQITAGAAVDNVPDWARGEYHGAN